ncbi:hypothetical protein ACQPZF_27980 [Actinosynnema sp. CS-041913]
MSTTGGAGTALFMVGEPAAAGTTQVTAGEAHYPGLVADGGVS